jgi:glycogen synthase
MTADAVGGVWQYSLDLGSALGRRGIRVVLAVMGPSPSEHQLRDAERAGIAVLSRPYRLEWQEEPWEDVARAAGWLLALERTIKPDVVHLNGYSHGALPWSAPRVVVAHSCVRSWWRAVHGREAPAGWDRYRSSVANGLAAADLVIAPTSAMRQALEAEYGLHASCRVIPNGLDHASRPEDVEKEPAILSAGRLWDEAKNVAAMCAVAGDLPWPVWVAGDDRGCGALETVRPLGRLSRDDVRAWMARASIYAHPARYEPFGLSILEAAAAGCALVLGDIPSLRENWDGAAVFVAPDDQEGLASALRALIGDPERRSTLADLARRRSRHFDIHATAEAYTHAYASALTAVCPS